MKKTFSDFLKEAKERGLTQRFQYDGASWDGMQSKVRYECKIHGWIEQHAREHLRRGNCTKCSVKYRSYTPSEVLKKLSTVHPHGRYTYNIPVTDNWCDLTKKFDIYCIEHGVFWNTLKNLLNGNGCSKCSKVYRPTSDEFLAIVRKIHPTLNYDRTVFNGMGQSITVRCSTHGEFRTGANRHVYRGHGCPACSNSNNCSRLEKEWLDGIGLPDDNSHRQVMLKTLNKRKIKVDGFNPITNTVYEFLGDFWHGNPEVYHASDINPRNKIPFGELYQQTVSKRRTFKEAGYNYVEIWERDYLKSSR